MPWNCRHLGIALQHKHSSLVHATCLQFQLCHLFRQGTPSRCALNSMQRPGCLVRCQKQERMWNGIARRRWLNANPADPSLLPAASLVPVGLRRKSQAGSCVMELLVPKPPEPERLSPPSLLLHLPQAPSERAGSGRNHTADVCRVRKAVLYMRLVTIRLGHLLFAPCRQTVSRSNLVLCQQLWTQQGSKSTVLLIGCSRACFVCSCRN